MGIANGPADRSDIGVGTLSRAPGMSERAFAELAASKNLRPELTMMDLGSIVSRKLEFVPTPNTDHSLCATRTQWRDFSITLESTYLSIARMNHDCRR